MVSISTNMHNCLEIFRATAFEASQVYLDEQIECLQNMGIQGYEANPLTYYEVLALRDLAKIIKYSTPKTMSNGIRKVILGLMDTENAARDHMTNRSLRVIEILTQGLLDGFLYEIKALPDTAKNYYKMIDDKGEPLVSNPLSVVEDKEKNEGIFNSVFSS